MRFPSDNQKPGGQRPTPESLGTCLEEQGKGRAVTQATARLCLKGGGRSKGEAVEGKEEGADHTEEAPQNSIVGRGRREQAGARVRSGLYGNEYPGRLLAVAELFSL